MIDALGSGLQGPVARAVFYFSGCVAVLVHTDYYVAGLDSSGNLFEQWNNVDDVQ